MESIDLGGIPLLFFEKVLNYCKTNPACKQLVKETFVSVLHQHLEYLIDAQQYPDIFICFAESQSVYPNDSQILNVLGVALNRLEKPLDALSYLKAAHQNSPKNLKIYENYENVINQWVARWHFSMLNDDHRNSSYKKAIQRTVQKGYQRVLDIGTGTGLLSLYSHAAGAKEIYACEEDEIMLDISRKVFQENGVSVNLIPEHSTNLCLEEMGLDRFDLIVTEIFDCGAFGEGVLSTLIHAKENLLTKGGVIVPNSIELFVVGVTAIGVGEKTASLNSTLENCIYFKDTILIPEADGPYEPFEQVSNHIQLVTEPASILKVDFNDLGCLKDAIAGKLDTTVQLTCLEDNSFEGFLIYFNLHLDDEVLTNFDPTGNDKKDRCWDPIIFPLNSPMPVAKYQILKADVSCKEGILKINHYYNNNHIPRKLRIDQNVFGFLADDEFMYELEFNVNKALKSNRKYHSIADFMPFPHIGINLLKENKIDKLYCSTGVRELVETIGKWNCICKSAIEYVDDLESLVNSDVKFDLILLQPISSHSTLKEEHLKYYNMLKEKSLTANGIIFPHKVDICCKLINSKWLDRVTHVQCIEGSAYGIEKHLNEYATKCQYDFIDYDANDLSEVFTISTVQFDESLHEKSTSVNLNSTSNLKINGILQFYKIYFLRNSHPVSTNRKKSFVKLNCFVEDFPIKEGKSNVNVNFIQNEYVFRCTINDEK